MYQIGVKSLYSNMHTLNSRDNGKARDILEWYESTDFIQLIVYRNYWKHNAETNLVLFINCEIAYNMSLRNKLPDDQFMYLQVINCNQLCLAL